MENKTLRNVLLLLLLFAGSTAIAQQVYRVYSAKKEVLFYNQHVQKWELAYLRKTQLDGKTLVKSTDHFDVENIDAGTVFHCGPSDGTPLQKLITQGYTPLKPEKGGTVTKSSVYDVLAADNERAHEGLNIHYLCVGVHHFQDSHWNPLKVPRVDLQRLSDAMCQVMVPSNDYHLGQHKLLYEERNTIADSIRSCIRMLIDSVGSNNGGTDMVMLYMSGHGEKAADGQFHFIATDTRYDSISGRYINSITATELNDYVSQLARKGTKVLVFIDACHAGAIRSSLQVDGSVVCYMSTEKDLYAYEDNQKGSPFAEALTASLEGSDEAQAYYHNMSDDVVTVFFLKSYIQRFVQDRYKLQSPDYETFNIRPESPLWKINTKANLQRGKLLLASRQGDVEAMVKLGDDHYFGGMKDRHLFSFDHDAYLIDVMRWDVKKTAAETPDTLPVDYEKAYDFYLKAYKQGNALAGCKLGICHYYGNGATKDAAKAVDYFSEAANKGVNLGLYYMGVCYAKGTGVEKNRKASKRYLRQVKELTTDIQTAFYTERVQCTVKDKYGETKLATSKSGDVFLIGMTSTDGSEREKRPSIYVMVVEAEAISGRAKSQAHMGFVCLDGLYGRRVDTDMAFMWFSKAAEKNNEYGLYGLAICYEEGKGVAKNEAKALEYYKKAGNLKCAGALIDLGNHFFAGTLGLEKSERDAVLCWKQAAQLGDKLGQYKYGACYLNGIGLIQNDQQAFEWFRKSAKQGFAAAQYKLGCCFLDGIGTQQDFKAAYQWLTKAEDQGHKEAKEVLSQYFDANGHYKP